MHHCHGKPRRCRHHIHLTVNAERVICHKHGKGARPGGDIARTRPNGICGGHAGSCIALTGCDGDPRLKRSCRVKETRARLGHAKVRVHGHFNGLKTTLLFALMWAIIMLIWWATGGSRQTLSIYIVIGLITTFGTYWFSDKLAIASMGAREVSEQEAPEIYQIVRELSAKAGKPMPRIYIAPTMSPNAFATGRNERHAAVCCTQGILQILNARELRGVLGHELMHVYNHDILTSAIASAMATVISYLGYSLMYFGGGSRDDRDSSGGLGLIGALLSVILAPIAASLIQMAISRTREYDADEDGSLLTGDPEALASALNKISYGAQTTPMRKTAGTQSVSAMMIANPFSAVGFSRLFSTHPPTDERIARLMQMANEMNGTPIAPPTYSTRVGR